MKITTYLPVLAVFAGVLLASSALHGDDKTEKKKTPKKSEEEMSKRTLEALGKSGIDPEILEQVKKAMESGESVSVSSAVVASDGKGIKLDRQKGGKVTIKRDGSGGTNGAVSVTTTVVGPDGNAITSTQRSENGVVVDVSGDGTKKSMTLDLGKLISEATAAAGGAKAEARSSADSSSSSKESSVSSSISGQVVVVDENGKVQTQSISAGLDSEALKKALGDALNSIDVKMLNQMINPKDLKNQAQIFGFGQPVIEDGTVSDRLDNIEKELEEQRKLLEKILKKL